jgi:hypothetical protein
MWSEVWGNAAEWTGAILTGGALFVAALVYRHDSKLSRSAQAKQVRPRIIGDPLADSVRVLVENYAENSIFRVGVELRRTSVYRAFLLDSAEGVIDPEKRKRRVRELVKPTYEKYRQVPREVKYYDDRAERLKGTDSLEYRVKRNSPFQQLFVTFIDAKGQHWEFGDLAAERQELRKIDNASEIKKSFRYPKKRLFRPFRAARELLRLFMARFVATVYQIRIAVAEAFTEAFKEVWKSGNYEQKLRDSLNEAVNKGVDQFKTDLAERRAAKELNQADPGIEPKAPDKPPE